MIYSKIYWANNIIISAETIGQVIVVKVYNIIGYYKSLSQSQGGTIGELDH